MLAAASQYCASNDIQHNQQIMRDIIAKAADANAKLVCLPECANLIAANKNELYAKAENAADSSTINLLQTLAKQHQIVISVGSLMLREAGEPKIYNRGLLISSDGAVLASYDKIHMFDANIGDGKRYRESEDFLAGTEIISCKSSVGHIGLSICYDVRFPQMYRKLARDGAQIIVTPAAFTAKTGAAHWHVLQRARAIETGSFIIAAAQYGRHADNRQTFGHALIVNPWGEIIAEANNQEANQDFSIITAELDLEQIVQARDAIGAWQTD